MSVVRARHLLLKHESAQQKKTILWARDRSREVTSSVTLTVDGKNTGCDSLPVISFPKLAYTGSARGHSGQWDGCSVTLVGYARLILEPPGQ